MSKTTKIVIGVLIAAAAVFGIASWAQASECVLSRDLSVGASGPDVACLQQTLLSGGFAIPAITSGAAQPGYFGIQTRAAVSAWQAAHNVTPSVGYFGPLSRAALALSQTPAPTNSSSSVPGCIAGALFSSTTGNSCSGPTSAPAGLAGTDGSISDVSELGSFNNEEVSEGDSAVKVLGADVEVSNDGDIALKSVKLSFEATGAGSDNLDDYVDSVSVWLGSTKVGSADVSGFSQDNNDVYTKTVTLNNAVIRADDTAKLYVAVDAASNIDSGDLAQVWVVDIENIRFVDGSGVITTDDSTGDVGAMNVPIDFVDFSTSADTEVKASAATNNPDAGIVAIDEDSGKDNVSLLKGKIKLEGNSDIVIDDFPVTLTVTGATDVDAVVNSITLKLGNETYTETVNTSSASEVVVFENLDFDVSAGDTVNFEVLADVNGIDAAFDEGDTLKASVTSANLDDMDIENEEGDQVSTTDRSGAVTGEEQEFRTNGISLTPGTTSSSVATGNGANDDQATFTIRFTVKAVGDDVYVSSLADAMVSIDKAGAPVTTGISAVLVNNTDDDLTTVGNYLIEEDTSETFELTVTVQLPTAGTAGLYRAALSSVNWSTADVTPAENSYTSNLDAYKTSYVGLN